MLRNQRANIASDDTEWSERSEYWRNYRPTVRGRPKKFKYREPLILCGHGVRIRMDHNTLFIRNGFTHYPQKAEEFRFFPGDSNLPDRIMILDGSGGLTFDALNWMSDQNIDFVRLDWRGKITNIGGNSGYSGNSKLIAAQRAIKGTRSEIEIARNLIVSKIEASIKTLKLVIPKSENREIAIFRLDRQFSKILRASKSLTISRILGIEGAGAAAYFAGWQGLPIKWTGFKRKPVPDNWREVSPRTMTWRKGTQNARHPVNAMLNYGYGILANEMRNQVITAGLDPTVGVIHGTAKNRMPLVYDLIEPLRPVVDRQILELALSHTFTPGDFTINKFGGCRINPQMAKTVAGAVVELETKSVVAAFVRQLHQ